MYLVGTAVYIVPAGLLPLVTRPKWWLLTKLNGTSQQALQGSVPHTVPNNISSLELDLFVAHMMSMTLKRVKYTYSWT